MADKQPESLSIGRIAKLAGVGVDTIRFYERRGLLNQPDRTDAGYPKYSAEVVSLLEFIRRAKALGFSLEEITSLLQLQDHGGPKASVKDITHRKLSEIDTKIDDLQRMRKVLHQLNNDCSGTGDINGCPIIEALSEDSVAKPSTTQPTKISRRSRS